MCFFFLTLKKNKFHNENFGHNNKEELLMHHKNITVLTFTPWKCTKSTHKPMTIYSSKISSSISLIRNIYLEFVAENSQSSNHHKPVTSYYCMFNLRFTREIRPVQVILLRLRDSNKQQTKQDGKCMWVHFSLFLSFSDCATQLTAEKDKKSRTKGDQK